MLAQVTNVDPAFVNQAADEPLTDVETFGYLRHGEQPVIIWHSHHLPSQSTLLENGQE